MSFRLFIYYCALCGGWAAFLTWGIVQVIDQANPRPTGLFRATLIAGILGALVSAAIGFVDSILNATGIVRLVRVLICAGFGLLGGAFGGFIGQVLYNYLNVPLVVGWMLAGILIGAGIGAFDIIRAVKSGEEIRAGVRKSINGVYGGLLGGLLGGLPFARLMDSTALPRSGQLIGLVLLGSCIGLMIGVAQVFLKEAWIKVEEGFRAGREIMLTKEETTIGRAETCDLGLFADNSIEKLHASIKVKNNHYLLEHVGQGGETLLNDEPVGGKPEMLHAGDRIRIGKSVLSFGERQKKKKKR
jgi:Inner membrane component of T3SS, cytoplasmic domain